MKTKLLYFIFTICVLFSGNAQSIPPYVPSAGLLGWWPFSGNANDQSGNNYNGTVSGASLTSDRFNLPNSAYEFDGINDRIMVNNFHNFFQSFSISCWIETDVLPNSTPTKWKGIIGKGTWGEGHGGDHTFFLNLQHNHFEPGGGLLIGFENAQGANTHLLYSANYASFLNNWRHVVATYNFQMNQFSLYVDGVLVAINEAGTVLNNSSAPLVIGNIFPPFNHSQVNGGYWDGKIDDIGIWNRALLSNEVFDLYQGCVINFVNQPLNTVGTITSNIQFEATSSDPNANYQWQTDLGSGFVDIQNTGQFSGANTNELTVSTISMNNHLQDFRCVATVGNCSDTSSVVTLTVINNLSLDEEIAPVLVYPNPMSNVLTIDVDFSYFGNPYKIFDLTGKMVEVGVFQQKSTNLNISHLPVGTYTLVLNNHRTIRHFKLVKI